MAVVTNTFLSVSTFCKTAQVFQVPDPLIIGQYYLALSPLFLLIHFQKYIHALSLYGSITILFSTKFSWPFVRHLKGLKKADSHPLRFTTLLDTRRQTSLVLMHLTSEGDLVSLEGNHALMPAIGRRSNTVLRAELFHGIWGTS